MNFRICKECSVGVLRFCHHCKRLYRKLSDISLCDFVMKGKGS